MAYRKVSVLVPTRKRPARLGIMLASYERTTRDVEGQSELVFRIDDDDDETYSLLSDYRHLVIVGPRKQGYASMPDFYNEMAKFATGDVFMIGNDDMVFRTPGWAPIILGEAGKYPDGLFDFGVKTFNEDHYPFATVSRKAVDRLGFIWDPRIFWGDMFLRDVMAHFGRALPLTAVEIDHDWIGFHPDRTFDEADQQGIMRRDPTYWAGTHRTAVNEAIEKLQGMML